jgi:F420-dependent oxidoreductase-like protein
MRGFPVRFGIQTAQQGVTWADLAEVWSKADAWGYDSLWAYDHFYPIFTDPSGPCLEGWTLLAALAGVTKRARIGHLVTGNTYRHPCVLAKMAATVDQISAGRLNLGIGSAWFEHEHQSFGIDFKTVPGRLGAFAESLQIIRGMLAGERVSMDGAHYRVHEAICRPLPVQKRLPIMIGGSGRKVLLRLVAEHADLWNSQGSPQEIRELVEVIERHCAKLGRDPATIEKTVMLPLAYTNVRGEQDAVCQLLGAVFGVSPETARARAMVGGREQCLEKIGQYVRAGCTHFIFMLLAPYPHDQIQSFAEQVIPAARAA